MGASIFHIHARDENGQPTTGKKSRASAARQGILNFYHRFQKVESSEHNMNSRSYKSYLKVGVGIRKKLDEYLSHGQMNKQVLGKLLNIILIIQLVTLVAILLDITFLRQAIGFVYLVFLPGFLFLKIIRLDSPSWIENILFSAGTSIAFLMLIGFLSSVLYPVLTIADPLSAFPVIATVFVFTFVLYVVSCRRTEHARSLGSENLSEQTATNLKFFPIIPLLVCIPILTIIGTQLVRSSGNNFILLFLVILTSAIVLCTFSRRIVPPETYLLVVLAISFFLLFQMALTSNYIIGYDVHLEYYLANLTSSKSIWNFLIQDEYNAMLSITVLPVIVSKFLNMDLNWVFKLFYPLVLLLVPLSLFKTYQKLTSSRIAFLSVFFFISLEAFYFTMLALDRQIIGELFFALLMLLIVEDKINLRKRKLLFIIFSAGLIVSHYATSYIFLFLIFSAFIVSRFFNRSDSERRQLITGGMVISIVALIFVWYILITPSPFEALQFTLNYIRLSILNQVAAPGLYVPLVSYVSIFHRGAAYLFYGLQLILTVGLVGSIVRYKKTKFSGTYLSMSLASFFILILCMVVPSFALGLVITRFYHITSFFLAPFIVLGILIIFKVIMKLRSRLPTFKVRHVNTRNIKSTSVGLFLISLLIVILFLFQVGFVYEIAGVRPSSLSLSHERVMANPSLAIDVWLWETPEQDVFSAKWLDQNKDSQSKVYADLYSNFMVLTSYGNIQTVYFSANSRFGTYDYILSNTSVPGKNAFIYLRTFNVIEGKIVGGVWASTVEWNTTAMSPFLDGCDSVYTNGGSEIYKKPF